MIFACTNGNYAGQATGNSGLSTQIATPGNHGAITFECNCVSVSTIDGDDSCQTGWYVGLATVIVAPCGHRAIVAYRKSKAPTCTYGGDASTCICWDIRLSEVVLSPSK